MEEPKIPAALRSYQTPTIKSINSPCCEGTTQLRSHTAAAARSNGIYGGHKKKRVKNPIRTHISRARGDPELTALQGSQEPATGWEPKRWGSRSSSASRGLSSLTETKSWSEFPPEPAIAGEVGATPLGTRKGTGNPEGTRGLADVEWGRYRSAMVVYCAEDILPETQQVGPEACVAHR